MGPSFLVTRIAVSFSAPLVPDKDPPNRLLPLLSTETNLQTPTSLWKRQRAGEKKKGENPPTCQQIGKKITQALSHSAVGLLLPPTVAAAPASWTGTWLCAVSLPTLSWLLSIPLPPPQLWGERVLEPRVEELEGRTDRATKCLWPTTNSVPITVLPNHTGDPLLIPGKEVKELSLTRQLFPQMLSPAPRQPVPSAASLYHFISTLCLQSNSLYSNLFMSYPFFTSAPVLGTIYF